METVEYGILSTHTHTLLYTNLITRRISHVQLWTIYYTDRRYINKIFYLPFLDNFFFFTVFHIMNTMSKRNDFLDNTILNEMDQINSNIFGEIIFQSVALWTWTYKAGIETGSKNGVGKRGRGKGNNGRPREVGPQWLEGFLNGTERDIDQLCQSEKKMINSIGHTEFEEPWNKEFYQAIKKFMTGT